MGVPVSCWEWQWDAGGTTSPYVVLGLAWRAGAGLEKGCVTPGQARFCKEGPGLSGKDFSAL